MDVLGYFKKAPKKVETAHVSCPVCWGYQQYDSEIRTVFKDKHVDVKNHKDKYMKVQKFMVEHLNGIQYKNRAIKKSLSVTWKSKNQNSVEVKNSGDDLKQNHN